MTLYQGGKELNTLYTPFSGTTKISNEFNKKLLDFCIITDKKNEYKYTGRGAYNRARRLENNYRGKLAELIIHKRYVGNNNFDRILKIHEKGTWQADVANEDETYKCNVKSQDSESIQRYGIGKFTLQDTNIKMMLNNKNIYTHIAGVLIFNPLKLYDKNYIFKDEDIQLKEEINWVILFHEPIGTLYNCFDEKNYNFTDENFLTKPDELKYQIPRKQGIGPWQKYIFNYNKLCKMKYDKII
jgi:hypothetical protein